MVAISGPHALRPVSPVDTPAEWVVAPILFAVFHRREGSRTEIAHQGRKHGLPPVGGGQSRKGARLRFLDESDQHARHSGGWRVVSTNPDRAVVADCLAG